MYLGLCICFYNKNYGSMLQAYATIKEIENRNIDYDIICYKKDWSFIIKNLGKIFNKSWQSEKWLVIQKKISRFLNAKYKKESDIRNACFIKFQNKYFNEKIKYSFGYKNLKKDALKYDAVLVGSDQMWSPSGLSTNFYNLMFVPDKIKKISYASSFGVSQIPRIQKKRTSQYLNRINFISVRENRAKEIVEELSNKSALVTVDPTLLLDKKEWEVFSGEEPLIKEAYIFAYFLGNNISYREEVKKLQKDTGLKIVSLRHLDQFVPEDEEFGDYAPYNVGPEQFVNIIKFAQYICTDSFHGTVFSTIFYKKFLTFPRYKDSSNNSKNSRVYSLLNNLGLEDRLFKNEDTVNMIKKEINYTDVDNKKRKLVLKSKEFLDVALED